MSAKTVRRKLTALGNFFNCLVTNAVVQGMVNTMRNISNKRVNASLPEVQFEKYFQKLLVTVRIDQWTYSLLLLSLETWIKLEKMFHLNVSQLGFSDKYDPEVYIKHIGKKEKKSRKLKLPMEITTVFDDYVAVYKVDETLFPYTQRFIRYLIAETTQKSWVKSDIRTDFTGYVRSPAAQARRAD